MATPAPASPQPGTGLPPGVEAGPLGARVVAYLIDSIVPAVLGVLLGLIAPNVSGSLQVIVSVVGGLLILGWVVLVLHGIATRAASPGMRLTKLQVVGFYDGRPIGWGRALIRYLIYALVNGTGIIWIIMIVMLVMHPRRQGWHDLAAKAVMIKERNLAPPRSSLPSVAGQAGQGYPRSPSSGQQPYDVATPRYPARDYPPQQQQYPTPYPPQQDYGQRYPGPGHPAAAPEPVGPPPGYDLPAAPAPTAPATTAPAPTTPSVAGASAFVPPPVLGPGSQPSAPDAYGDEQPTRAVPVVPPAQTWVAVLDDGREITVDGLVLLGRNPQPQPGEEDAQLIKLADETRTVSKSHLAIGLDAAGLFVVDRGSTNGSTVTTPDGVSTRCQPGDVIYVEVGSIVSIGDHWLEVRQVG